MSQDLQRPVAALIPPIALRVCIVAENASFRFGGEASLPLHYFSRLRHAGVQAWLIVHGRTQRELEALFPKDQDHIRYIPDRWYHRAIWMLGRPLPRRIAESTLGLLMVLVNQVIQRRMVRLLIRTDGINVVHQPIPVSPRAPSFIVGLGAPVVIGPMNGGMDYPVAFRGGESLFTRLIVHLGRLSASIVNSMIAGKRFANVLLVANERTRNALPVGANGNVIEMAENAVDLSIWSPSAEPGDLTSNPRFVFVGRLVEWKRLDFVLRALVDCPGALLEIIGEGPMREAWTGLARTLGVAGRVDWRGWLPQAECAKRLQGATALVLPSIYECGGAVILEAMACAVPVVALDWGGPADYVDDSCGILIAPSDETSIVKGFSDAQRRLAADPGLRVKMGAAGRRRVEMHYDWNRKVERIVDIYRGVLAENRT